MEALVSGQAGVATVLGRGMELRRLGHESGQTVPQFLLGRIFADCNDVQIVTVHDAAELDKITSERWSADRALRMILMLLDGEGPDSAEYAACCEELLAQVGADLFVRRNLYCAPLPTPIPEVVRDVAAPYPKTAALLDDLLNDQGLIERVRDAFDAISPSLFGSPEAKQVVFELAVTHDAFVNLVLALKRETDVNFVVLDLLSHMRHVENARDIISRWTAEMRTSRMPATRIDFAEEDDEFELFDENARKGVAGRQAYENALRQQGAIIDRLKSRDIAGARRFVDDLLKTQSQTSSPEHIAKSLSRLSQFAKRLGVPELQLEWAQQAVEANSTDPKTFGHLADALILAGRYNEASNVLDSAESAGDRQYAETGRARILRATGRLDEAREKYLAAAAEFPTDRHSQAGAAEVLRDMGRHEDALAEYIKLTNLDPLESHFWAGRASVLMDLGRFDEAISFFGRASKVGDDNVPKNGKATAYKLAGQFDKALQLYDEVIKEFPNDAVGLSGRAEVFRAQGDLEKALEAYDVAISRSPFVPIPISGKVEVLKELGRYSEAEVLLNEASGQFPYDQSLAGAYASILKSQARYSEALAAYDDVVRRFPFSLGAKLSRIDVLKRMESLDEALTSSEKLIALRPTFMAAQISRASILILQGKLQQAETLLPAHQPKSQTEWSRFLVRALLLEQKGDIKASREMLRKGTHSPFARIARLFKATLAQRELQAGRATIALEIVDASPENNPDVTNVIQLHAFLATGRRSRAETLFATLQSSVTARPYIDLSVEIGRRFNLVKMKPLHSREWIFNAENRALLLDAA